jgi:hypothetical protein
MWASRIQIFISIRMTFKRFSAEVSVRLAWYILTDKTEQQNLLVWIVELLDYLFSSHKI